MPFPLSQTFPRTKHHSGPLLTVANLDRMAPPRPKNPNRIPIWAYEVSIACACYQDNDTSSSDSDSSPSFWKKVLRRNSGSSSKSKSKADDLNLSSAIATPKESTEIQHTAMYQPGKEPEGGWAYSCTGNAWNCYDYEGDNGESSLDMQSSESGVVWGARDRAQRLDRAERLLNTDTKKWKAAALRQATEVEAAC
jgi:hypothetical protein